MQKYYDLEVQLSKIGGQLFSWRSLYIITIIYTRMIMLFTTETACNRTIDITITILFSFLNSRVVMDH